MTQSLPRLPVRPNRCIFFHLLCEPQWDANKIADFIDLAADLLEHTTEQAQINAATPFSTFMTELNYNEPQFVSLCRQMCADARRVNDITWAIALRVIFVVLYSIEPRVRLLFNSCTLMNDILDIPPPSQMWQCDLFPDVCEAVQKFAEHYPFADIQTDLQHTDPNKRKQAAHALATWATTSYNNNGTPTPFLHCVCDLVLRANYNNLEHISEIETYHHRMLRGS